MYNSKRSKLWFFLASASLGVLAALMLTSSSPATAVSSIDHGFAVGVYYKGYSGGDAEFDANFYNNGEHNNLANPQQDVLTTTANGVAAQIAIYIYSNSSTQLDDEAWSLATGNILFHNNKAVGGLTGGMHDIMLTVELISGTYYIRWYLDSTWENSWTIATNSFSNEMVPSFVIESADTTSGDWTNRIIYGYLNANTGDLNTFFYGGTWGGNNAGCTVSQSSGYYVGENTESPANVGVSGHVLSGYGATWELTIGNVRSPYFPLSHPIIQNAYQNFHSNACTTVQVS